jgi:hypothetical protein
LAPVAAQEMSVTRRRFNRFALNDRQVQHHSRSQSRRYLFDFPGVWSLWREGWVRHSKCTMPVTLLNSKSQQPTILALSALFDFLTMRTGGFVRRLIAAIRASARLPFQQGEHVLGGRDAIRRSPDDFLFECKTTAITRPTLFGRETTTGPVLTGELQCGVVGRWASRSAKRNSERDQRLADQCRDYDGSPILNAEEQTQ